MTPADMIEKYLALRNKIKQLEDKHKEELKPYQDVKLKLEDALLGHLLETGTESARCKAGTAFKSTATSVTVKDWALTLAFIQANQLWDLLEARVSKTAAVEIIDERKEPIPGVQISQATVLRVRAG